MFKKKKDFQKLAGIWLAGKVVNALRPSDAYMRQ